MGMDPDHDRSGLFGNGNRVGELMNQSKISLSHIPDRFRYSVDALSQHSKAISTIVSGLELDGP